MNGEMTEKLSSEEREKSRVAMLKEALSRPGVHEIMQIYGGWQEADRALNSYRSVTMGGGTITATDHTDAT